MGGFYGSVQLRTADRAAVKIAAGAVAKEKSIRCLVGPVINGWTGVYPEDPGLEGGIGAGMAQRLACDVLQLMVHDDDILAYRLWRDHQLVDSYWSKPGHFGEENRAEGESSRGNAENFRGIVADKVEKLAALLDRKAEYTFESERLAKLTKLLGIFNAVTAYDYLVSDERDGIKAWRKFEKIPPDPVAPSTVAAKAKSKPRKAIRDKLRKSGHLLYSHEWNEFTQLAKGFPMGEGFVLGWVNPWQKTAELFQLLPPLYAPELLPFDVNKFAAHTQADLVVVDSGGQLRIMGKSSSPWKQLAELQNDDRIDFAAISPTGQYIACLNQRTIVVRKVPSGDRVCEIQRKRSSRIAFHPSAKWLAVTGDQLGLLCFDGSPSLREIMVGGKHRLIERFTPETQDAICRRYRKNEVVTRILDLENANEESYCVGFSRDGRLMWCGTDLGLRVYGWAALSQESGGITNAAIWRYRNTMAPPGDLCQQVNAIEEEIDGAGIVFGGTATQIMRLDLRTGVSEKLVDLPGGGKVESLAFSRDGRALAVSSCLTVQKGPRSMPSHTTSWEVWDYHRLREQSSDLT